MKLRETVQSRTVTLKEMAEEVRQAELLLQKAKDKHAQALQKLHEVKVFDNFATNQTENTKNLFQWTREEHEDRYGSGGKRHDSIYYKYKGINYDFEIHIKHRKDLKVWKYEVSIDGKKMHYEDFGYVPMYDRERRSGYSKGYNGHLKKVYQESELFEKFKTIAEAEKFARDWKKKLEKDFKKELDFDIDMYNQACKKYDNVIRIELDMYTNSQTAFWDMIKYYPDVEIVNGYKGGRTLELGGSNIKEIIHDLNNKYKMGIKVLAG